MAREREPLHALIETWVTLECTLIRPRHRPQQQRNTKINVKMNGQLDIRFVGNVTKSSTLNICKDNQGSVYKLTSKGEKVNVNFSTRGGYIYMDTYHQYREQK